MPKPKPTEIIRHEIVLGRSEKDLLEGFLYGSEFNKAAATAVRALSDPTFILAAVSLLAIFHPDLKALLPKNPLDVGETIDAVSLWVEKLKEEAEETGEDWKDKVMWWATLNPLNLPFRVGEEVAEDIIDFNWQNWRSMF